MLSQKLGDLIRALFGWSVSALFGRQSSTKSTALSIALALSVLWPLFVVGTIVPAAAAWVLAFLPLERWLGPTILRVVWIALAFTAPLIVGAITRWVAPSRRVKGSALRTVLGGFPLTIGYMLSFLVTAVTVPVMKIAAAARRWSEEHAYVQPRENEYDAVLHTIAEAFQRAGVSPTVEDVPASMSFATRALKFFARGVVSPMVPEDPKRVRGDGVEAYLYPADLVLRGDKRKVAHVRSELMGTSLDEHAYLVETREAQHIQEEAQRLWKVVDHHAHEGHALGGTAATRLREMHGELRKVDVSFDEWAMLERILRKLERRVAGGPRILDEGHDDPLTEPALQPAMLDMARLDRAPLTDLVKGALGDARELVRLEVELAKAEAKKELRGVVRAAIGFVVAAASAFVGLFLFVVAIVLALGGSPLAAVGVAAGFLVAGGVAAVLGYRALPKSFMEHTVARVRSDVQQLKESTA